MPGKLSESLNELKQAVQGEQEASALLETEDSHTEVKFSVSPKDFLKFMEKAISGVTQKVLGSFKSDIQSDLVKQNQLLLYKLDQLIVKGKMEISNPQDIRVKEITVKNLDDLRPPVIQFPDKIATEIVKTVETLDLQAITTKFDRDPMGRVRTITEDYGKFQVTSTFKRDRNEDIVQISTEVTA